MFSYSLTTMMCFLIKEWYGISAYTVNLFIKAYHRITYKEDLKPYKSVVSLIWYAFLCGFGYDVLFTIDHLRSISFFYQNAHHDWLTKEYISNWFLVQGGWYHPPDGLSPATQKRKRKWPRASRTSVLHPVRSFWWKKKPGVPRKGRVSRQSSKVGGGCHLKIF